MIRYSLSCERGHSFDGWFRSSADHDDQAARGLLSCPVCGSSQVTKALMAPAVSSPSQDVPSGEMALLGEQEAALRAKLRALREEVTRNARNVGPQFATVARQMHEGEIERDSVYGRATPDEVRSLAEDGIEFHPLPGLPDEGN